MYPYKGMYVFALFWICTAAEIRGNADVQTIFPSDAKLHWFGRKVLDAAVARFDWIGVGVSLRLASDSVPSEVGADIDGHGERFAVYVDQVLVNDFIAGGRKLYYLASAKPGEVVTLVKATEAQTVDLHSIKVRADAKMTPWSQLPARRIEFWGDSDSAAFGVDSDSSWWSLLGCAVNPNKYQNFAHGWVQGVLHALGAEGQVQAISGIGVVKNGGGGGTLTLPKLVARRLHNAAKDDYNASSWQPDLIVIYVGSNDFINQVVPSANEFNEAYSAMVKHIVESHHLKVEVPVLHLCEMHREIIS